MNNNPDVLQEQTSPGPSKLFIYGLLGSGLLFTAGIISLTLSYLPERRTTLVMKEFGPENSGSVQPSLEEPEKSETTTDTKKEGDHSKKPISSGKVDIKEVRRRRTPDERIKAHAERLEAYNSLLEAKKLAENTKRRETNEKLQKEYDALNKLHKLDITEMQKTNYTVNGKVDTTKFVKDDQGHPKTSTYLVFLPNRQKVEINYFEEYREQSISDKLNIPPTSGLSDAIGAFKEKLETNTTPKPTDPDNDDFEQDWGDD